LLSLTALVSRHPVYDLMRDYLTLSWARFSKDVQSHTLQISKILAHPAPRPGELIRLDASPKTDGSDSNLEVIARFPGGLDFGRGLVDINFTMWPLFKCLNIDNILTICEVKFASFFSVQRSDICHRLLLPQPGKFYSFRDTLPCLG
jgi:nicotinamide N-methyltransferase